MLYTKIKAIAKSKGIPIYKLEEQLNISVGSLCKWNDNKPSYDKVIKVADLLGVTVEELLKE